MKGLNLTDTDIAELRININPDHSDAVVKTLIPIIDENGDIVNYETKIESWNQLSNQRRANLNNYLKLSNLAYNQEFVNENKDSWTDI